MSRRGSTASQPDLVAPTIAQAMLQGRVITGEIGKLPRISDHWTHTKLSFDQLPAEYEEYPGEYPRKEQVDASLALISLPGIKYHGIINSDSAPVVFYTPIIYEADEDNIKEAKLAIEKVFNRHIITVDVSVMVNNFEDCGKKLEQMVCNTNIHNRKVVFFILDTMKSLDTPFIKIPILELISQIPFAEIFNLTFEKGIHILDCDYAGCMRANYLSLLDGMSSSGQKPDMFVFMSCSEDQTMHRSSELPTDFFTSCLVYPARTALLWHSWHYYCFKGDQSPQKQPLQPLTMADILKIDPVLERIIMDAMRSIVEAMLLDVLTPHEFVYYMKRDSFLADTIIGYILACHIFQYFDMTPSSIPTLPNLNFHSLWPTLWLRLDAALYAYYSPIKTAVAQNTEFSEFTLSTMEVLIESNSDASAFSYSLSSMTNALRTESLQNKALTLLALVFDKGIEVVRMASNLMLLETLADIMCDSTVTPELLLCVSKLIWYCPDMRSLLAPEISVSYISDEIYPLLKGCSSLYVFGFLALLVRGHEDFARILLSTDWVSRVLSGIESTYSDVKVWAMLFISTLSPYLPPNFNSGSIVDAILTCMEEGSVRERIAGVYTLSCLSGTLCDQKILAGVMNYVNDMHGAVRTQLITLVSEIHFYHVKDDPADPLMMSLLKIATEIRDDPYLPIARRALEVYTGIMKQIPTSCSSPVFEYFCIEYVGPISTYLDKSNVALYDYGFLEEEDAEELYPEVKFSMIKKSWQTMPFPVPLSSRICFDFKNNVFIGNAQGSVISLSSEPYSKPKYYGSGTHPICDLSIIENSGYNLLFCTNTKGHFHTFYKEDTQLQCISAFRALPEKYSYEPCFDISQYNMKLAMYDKQGRSPVHMFDLEVEKEIGQIPGSYSSARFHPYFDNVIILCGETISLHDSRMKLDEQIMSFDVTARPFAAEPVGYNSLYIAVCHENGSVSTLDWRTTTTSAVYRPVDPIPPSDLCCFSSHKCGSICFVGHKKGGVVYDLLYDQKLDLAARSLLLTKPLKSAVQADFDPSKLMLAAVQNTGEVVFFV